MNYDKAVEAWQWNLPTYYNLAVDCVDKNALINKQRKNKVALYWEDGKGEQKKLTFSEVATASNRFANGLKALGVKRGDRLVLRLGNVPEFQICFIGGIKAGAIPVSTSPLLSAAELAYRVNDTSAVALVTDLEHLTGVETALESCSSLRQTIVVGEEDHGYLRFSHLMEQGSPYFDVPATSVSEPAFISYTSGTVGNWKGVVHSHRWVLGNEPSAVYWQDYREDDIVASTAPLNWIFPLGIGFLYAWRRGVSVFIYDGPWDPEKWFWLLQKYRITNLASVPTAYRSLLSVDGAELRYDLKALRHCTSCGEPLNAEVVEEWKERFSRLILDGIGMTECMTYISNMKGMAVKPGSCGRTQPGHVSAVVDAQIAEPLPRGREGVVAIKRGDPGLFAEYWNLPDETTKAFVKDWFLTGDIAYLDEEGYYWFIGRAADLISTPDGLISPFKVESALLRHSAVLEVAAIPACHSSYRKSVKCFVVLMPGYVASEGLARGILETTRLLLNENERPQEIEFVPDLPKTHSGKIKRKMLRELERSKQPVRIGVQAPSPLGHLDFLSSLADTGVE